MHIPKLYEAESYDIICGGDVTSGLGSGQYIIGQCVEMSTVKPEHHIWLFLFWSHPSISNHETGNLVFNHYFNLFFEFPKGFLQLIFILH